VARMTGWRGIGDLTGAVATVNALYGRARRVRGFVMINPGVREWLHQLGNAPSGAEEGC